MIESFNNSQFDHILCNQVLRYITGAHDIHDLLAVSTKIFGRLSKSKSGSVAIVHLFRIGKFHHQ
jgi:hypothetical protein